MNRVAMLLRLVWHTGATLAVAALFDGVHLLAAVDKAAAPKPEAHRVEWFKIAVEEAVLRDLNDRLGRTRWPDSIALVGVSLTARNSH